MTDRHATVTNQHWGADSYVAAVEARRRTHQTSWILTVSVLVVSAVGSVSTADEAFLLFGLVGVALGIVSFPVSIRRYYLLALLANFVAVRLLAAWFLSTRGVPFTPGGDDYFFYTETARVAEQIAGGDWDVVSGVRHLSGAGYIVLGGWVTAAVQGLGISSSFILPLLSAVIGATIAPAAWHIATGSLGLRSEQVGARIATGVALFPVLTYYSAVGLRDILIAAAASWFVYCLTSGEPTRLNRSLLWPLLLLGVVAALRVESAIPLVAAWVWATQVGANTPKGLLLKLVVTVSVVVIASRLVPLLLVDIAREAEGYYTLAATESGSGSIGLRVMTFPSPLGDFLRFGFAAFAPVPPIRSLELDNLLLGVGAIIWYYALPFLTAGVWSVARKSVARKPDSRKAGMVMAVLILSSLVGISVTSIDPRHKTLFHPIALVLAAVGAYNMGMRRSVVVAFGYSFVLICLAMTYVAVKF